MIELEFPSTSCKYHRSLGNVRYLMINIDCSCLRGYLKIIIFWRIESFMPGARKKHPLRTRRSSSHRSTFSGERFMAKQTYHCKIQPFVFSVVPHWCRWTEWVTFVENPGAEWRKRLCSLEENNMEVSYQNPGTWIATEEVSGNIRADMGYNRGWKDLSDGITIGSLTWENHKSNIRLLR